VGLGMAIVLSAGNGWLVQAGRGVSWEGAITGAALHLASGGRGLHGGLRS
jgi:hypothetical protein